VHDVADRAGGGIVKASDGSRHGAGWSIEVIQYIDRYNVGMPGTPALDAQFMRAAAGEAVAALKALGNPERLLLLCQMSQGEVSVGDLEALLDIHQPTLSQQLGVLRREGMVATRREGKKVFYRIADPRLLALLRALYKLYCPKEGA
jgi:ArsR family transcriptional regulator